MCPWHLCVSLTPLMCYYRLPSVFDVVHETRALVDDEAEESGAEEDEGPVGGIDARSKNEYDLDDPFMYVLCMGSWGFCSHPFSDDGDLVSADSESDDDIEKLSAKGRRPELGSAFKLKGKRATRSPALTSDDEQESDIVQMRCVSSHPMSPAC